MRNVTSLHHLLDDVTSLARLQAGREARQIEPLDVTPILQSLCEGIRPLAEAAWPVFALRGARGLRRRWRCRENPPHRAKPYSQRGQIHAPRAVLP